jgi:hypothetical protein
MCLIKSAFVDEKNFDVRLTFVSVAQYAAFSSGNRGTEMSTSRGAVHTLTAETLSRTSNVTQFLPKQIHLQLLV